MGATVAFRAADEIPELRAVAVDSGPMIFVRDYFNYVLQNKRVKGFWAKKVFLFLYLHVVGFSGMQKRTTACLRRHRRCPALLIHSKSDRIIPYRDALFTYSLLSPETGTAGHRGKGAPSHKSNRTGKCIRCTGRGVFL